MIALAVGDTSSGAVWTLIIPLALLVVVLACWWALRGRIS
jgi:hypothetical protein